MTRSYRFLILIATLGIFGEYTAIAANSLSTKLERDAERIADLESQLEAGKISELEATLYKTRLAAERETSLEPALTEEERGVVRNIRLLSASDRAGAMSNILLAIDEESVATFDFIAGSFFAERSDWSDAQEHFKAAIEKYPNYLEALKNLGIVSIRMSDWSEARSSLLKAYSLQVEPDGDILGMLGLCYANTGEWATAELYYEKALYISTDKDWLTGLVNALLRQGKHKAALPFLEELRANETSKSELARSIDSAPEPIELDIRYDAVGDQPDEGFVVVEFLVTTSGKAIDARVIEISDTKFLQATIFGLSESKWKPAVAKGKPISVRVRKRFTFGK